MSLDPFQQKSRSCYIPIHNLSELKYVSQYFVSLLERFSALQSKFLFFYCDFIIFINVSLFWCWCFNYLQNEVMGFKQDIQAIIALLCHVSSQNWDHFYSLLSNLSRMSILGNKNSQTRLHIESLLFNNCSRVPILFLVWDVLLLHVPNKTWQNTLHSFWFIVIA